MSFREFSFIFCLLAIASSSLRAQDPVKPGCPAIAVTTDTSSVANGATAAFNVEVKGANDIGYNWSVSYGTISSGQGTARVMVNTMGLRGGYITVTVEISGIAEGCTNIASGTISVDQPKPSAELYGKAAYTTPADFKAVMDKFVTDIEFLLSDPFATRTIFFYPGKDVKAATDAKEMDKICRAAFKKAGVGESAFEIKMGGKMDKTSYELYTVGSYATPPVPDPLP